MQDHTAPFTSRGALSRRQFLGASAGLLGVGDRPGPWAPYGHTTRAALRRAVDP